MLGPSSIRLTLVIPVYNTRVLASSLQQAWEWLGERPYPSELLVVDDGSAAETAQILAEFAAAHPGDDRRSLTTLRNAQNRGKGFSIRRALLHARGASVVFTDADLTYPLENVDVIVQALAAGADLAYGNRMHADSRYVVAPSFFGKLFTRHVMGRAFNLLLRLLVVRGILDSQAGLKGFSRAAAELLARRVRLSRFSFDVELFFVARRHRLRLCDCPVHFIYRKEPSTVRFGRDSLAMVRDMLLVRWRGLLGVYDRDLDPVAIEDLRHGGALPEGGVPSLPARRSPASVKTG